MSSTGIAIVWPAWFLTSTDPQLHCTALFLGNTETTPFDREVIQEVVDNEALVPGAIRVAGTALFGTGRNVPVLTLRYNHVLDSAQEWMVRELEMRGIASPSEFDFNPHVTISKEIANPWLPHYIQLEAPVLWWGPDRQIHSKHSKQHANALKVER